MPEITRSVFSSKARARLDVVSVADASADARSRLKGASSLSHTRPMHTRTANIPERPIRRCTERRAAPASPGPPRSLLAAHNDIIVTPEHHPI